LLRLPCALFLALCVSTACVSLSRVPTPCAHRVARLTFLWPCKSMPWCWSTFQSRLISAVRYFKCTGETTIKSRAKSRVQSVQRHPLGNRSDLDRRLMGKRFFARPCRFSILDHPMHDATRVALSVCLSEAASSLPNLAKADQ